ncbi:MAG: condensation domain-containing protein, partial [Chthoniobacterales bacterium]
MTASNPAHELWWRSTGLQRAMILASLNPDSLGAYHQQLILRLEKEIDGRVFLRAAHACLERHGGVMARFEMRDGELFQTCIAGPAPAADEIDLQNEPGDPESRLQNFLERDAAQNFEIFGPHPLWRSSLLSLGEEERAWVWSHHHALCDTACVPLLLEIFRSYDGMRDGGFPPSESASPDFFDYLSWREEQDWAAREVDWRERFQPGDRVTSLPEVRGALATSADSGRGVVPISSETERGLRKLCEQFSITLNTIVIAAWGLWLARVQEEKRAIFGIMREARRSSFPGAETIVGLLTNTVPIAVEIPDEMPVIDWLQTVRRELIALRALEHCSLGNVAQWTGLELGPDGPPSVINFQRRSLADAARAGGLSAGRARISIGQKIDVPLMVSAHELPQLRIEIVSRPALVNPASAEAAARGLSAVLHAIAQAPQARLTEIDLLSEYDRAVLKKFESGPRVEIAEPNGHALLERQIRERPHALALKQGARELTLAQLDEM